MSLGAATHSSDGAAAGCVYAGHRERLLLDRRGVSFEAGDVMVYVSMVVV